MKSNVCLVIQRVHFCLQQLLTCMNVGTHSTVCKTKTNAPLVHTLHTRMQSLVKKKSGSVRAKNENGLFEGYLWPQNL